MPKPPKSRTRSHGAPFAPPSASASAPEAPTVAPPGFAEWSALGAALAARGPHRLALATRIARATTAGGADVSREEEDRLAAWFAGLVDLALERAGDHPDARGGDRNPAGEALWYLLAAGDCTRALRAPAMDGMPCPDEAGFVEALRTAAPGYLRAVIAGASERELAELRALVEAGDEALEPYRPLGRSFADGAPAADTGERALSLRGVTRPTHTQRCQAVAQWAAWYADLTVEHAIPPVHRVGTVAWLARVALCEERAS
jgi:hypothetical protein